MASEHGVRCTTLAGLPEEVDAYGEKVGERGVLRRVAHCGHGFVDLGHPIDGTNSDTSVQPLTGLM
jgi:hypothetical protein